MKILRERDHGVLADEVEIARSPAARLRGLLGRRRFPRGSALVIPACRQVHTFFMRFGIDVIFLGVDRQVLRVVRDIKPYRITPYCRGAAYAVELPAGAASDLAIEAGDVLLIEGVTL